MITQPGEYRAVGASRRSRGTRSSSRSFAACAELVNDDGRTPLRAGQRAYARADAAPSYAYAFNSASWDAFDRWSEARRDQRLGVSAQYLPSEVQPYASVVRSVRRVAIRHLVRLRLVPVGRGRLASVLSRPLGHAASVRLDVGRRRSVGLANASLRPMGLLGRLVVLDSRTQLGTGLGLVGVRAGLRELVSARLEQPRGPVVRLQLRLRPVARMDRRCRTRISAPATCNVHYVGGYGFNAHTRAAFVPRYTAPAYTGYAVPRSSVADSRPGHSEQDASHRRPSIRTSSRTRLASAREATA